MTDFETIIYMIRLQTDQVLFSTTKTLLYILPIYWNGLNMYNVIIEVHTNQITCDSWFSLMIEIYQ